MPSSRYTSKIIKAGALLADTKILLSHWNIAIPLQKNLQRLQRENVFGKASRSRVQDIVAIFRQRYLLEERVPRALAALVAGRFPAAALDRILYFHAARGDRLLFDVVTEILVPMQAQGLYLIDTIAIEKVLAHWIHRDKMTTRWSDSTRRRVTQGLLATLRDFGVLQGAANKRIAPAHLPIAAFAYVAFYLKQRQPSGAKLLELPDWKLFFLLPEGVERLLVEAHQHHLLEYHAAGAVTRLSFPAETLEEYAHVLVESAH